MPDLTSPGDGGMLHGHLAVPGGPGTVPPPERWPGVVVIHEALGLTESIRQQADRLASQGYLAFAPDLYGPAAYQRWWLARRASMSRKTSVISFRSVPQAGRRSNP